MIGDGGVKLLNPLDFRLVVSLEFETEDVEDENRSGGRDRRGESEARAAPAGPSSAVNRLGSAASAPETHIRRREAKSENERASSSTAASRGLVKVVPGEAALALLGRENALEQGLAAGAAHIGFGSEKQIDRLRRLLLDLAEELIGAHGAFF